MYNPAITCLIITLSLNMKFFIILTYEKLAMIDILVKPTTATISSSGLRKCDIKRSIHRATRTGHFADLLEICLETYAN